MTKEEAIEALTSKDVCNSDMMLEALDMAIEALNQQKEGHWIKVNDYVNKIYYKECSCCSVKISFNLPFLDYCPKCGAKMFKICESEGNE